jgi:hypothetical protein
MKEGKEDGDVVMDIVNWAYIHASYGASSRFSSEVYVCMY